MVLSPLQGSSFFAWNTQGCARAGGYALPWVEISHSVGMDRFLRKAGYVWRPRLLRGVHLLGRRRGFPGGVTCSGRCRRLRFDASQRTELA